jgi:hypothetical protein
VGFSEWDSNVYYPVTMAALVNLADFAPDAEIRRWRNLQPRTVASEQVPQNGHFGGPTAKDALLKYGG